MRSFPRASKHSLQINFLFAIRAGLFLSCNDTRKRVKCDAILESESACWTQVRSHLVVDYMIKGSLLIDANLPNSTGDDNVTAVTHNNTFPHHLITSEDFPN